MDNDVINISHAMWVILNDTNDINDVNDNYERH